MAGFPAWIDPNISAKMMTRRKRKSLTEANSYRLTNQVSNFYREGCYKNAYKACTTLLQPTMATEDSSRGRCLVTAKKSTVSMVRCYCPQTIGSSRTALSLKGRPLTIPSELTHGLACYAVMMQSSGKGEASSIKMRAIGGALMLGTPHKNKFSMEYLWCQTRN